MEMKRLHAGKLRAIGYDKAARCLRVEFEDGRAIEYDYVGEDVWRRFSQHASPWSFYRDHIEEEFHRKPAAKRPSEPAQNSRAALDALFGGASNKPTEE